MEFIDGLFDAQVDTTPDAVAVVFEGRSLTYCELHRRAEELGARLRALGVGPNVLVALFLERSLEMVVALLGVLKAGGAYLPLDPSHPPKRLAYTLENARPLVVLTQTRLRADLPPHSSHLFVIDDRSAQDLSSPSASLRSGRTARDLAYVIYTSGSTGEPKGVEIEHRAVVNLLESMATRPGLSAEDTMLALTTLAFDISALEIFLPLSRGACVVVASAEMIGDGVALSDLIESSRVSVIQATPTTLRMLLDAGWKGSPRLKILCGGEAWNAELARKLLPRCGSLWNMYGPTETTVWSAATEVEAGQPIVIGPPIANTRFYVLDDGASRLVPVGGVGELFIAGDGLARGYRDLPQLTSERFVADPFVSDPGARMYSTGDRMRRLPKGALEFVGRLDQQVKIRGHRIELGDIEAALERLDSVERCAVVAREDSRGELRLVAYVLPTRSAANAGEFRALLSESVPSYMIPSLFITVTSFSLTANGKLDRKALPPPDTKTPRPTTGLVPPRTSTEERVARVWRDFLDIEQIGVHDDFFDLGGDSIMAVGVIANINKKLDANLRIIDFHSGPTIEALSAKIERSQISTDKSSLYYGPKIVQLKHGNNGLPVYFIGAGPVEFHIGSAIAGNRSIFATDVPLPLEWRRAILGADRSTVSLDQLGELYADLVSEHAGSTPCIIAGYSFGGKLAFEAAHALQRKGGNVAFVLLIDAFTWSSYILGSAKRSFFRIWLGPPNATAKEGHHTNSLAASLRDSLHLAVWLLARTPHRLKERIGQHPLPYVMFDSEGRPMSQSVIDQLAHLAGKSFHPRPIDAPGVLIRGTLPDEDSLPAHDYTNGWGHLFAPGLKVIQAKGDHRTMISDELNFTELSIKISAVIDEYSLPN